MTDSRVPPADLELRLVRYFTVVADELHFGRAADVLRLAQPSLSRQIRRLEQQLGARLLDRTPRGTRLTEAGEIFLPQARELLRTAARATASARSAAGHGPFTVGYTTNLIVTPAVRELRHGYPEADVRAAHLSWSEPRDALLDHRVDVVAARLVFAGDGLEITPLYEEPRVLLVPLGHRLAGKESVTLDDIADETLPRFAGIDGGGANPPGHTRLGALVETLEDKLELVAGDDVVSLAPAGFAANLRPDIVSVPVSDALPVRVVLATRSGERHPLLAAFRRAAATHLVPPAERAG
ncbi:LysR family transcriptional regulator [Streptomyces sp. AK02-01A]|uniref:LysR family transcriptional regulator n=1 Tax=Streptomyces sp. AK02-01A TaxID=3028648 RepID=UPI0029B5F4BD|nr:LysR family transcriptional regulator [Streptomyces sp. AK02-01A]MDX3849405.1 LysR family transcriptional regulator [Streptomyces sp. AK02-01A]